MRDQLRQPPRHSCRVWQFEFRCKFARDENFCHRPMRTLRLDASVYFDYTRLTLSLVPTGCRQPVGPGIRGTCRGSCRRASLPIRRTKWTGLDAVGNVEDAVVDEHVVA